MWQPASRALVVNSLALWGTGFPQHDNGVKGLDFSGFGFNFWPLQRTSTNGCLQTPYKNLALGRPRRHFSMFLDAFSLQFMIKFHDPAKPLYLQQV